MTTPAPRLNIEPVVNDRPDLRLVHASDVTSERVDDPAEDVLAVVSKILGYDPASIGVGLGDPDAASRLDRALARILGYPVIDDPRRRLGMLRTRASDLVDTMATDEDDPEALEELANTTRALLAGELETIDDDSES